MQTRIIHRLVKKHIFPNFEGWALYKDLLYGLPLDMMLYGYCFSGDTVDKESCRIWEFGMPLFVPRDRLMFNFGDLLRGKSNRTYYPIGGLNGLDSLAEVNELLRSRIDACHSRFGSVAAFVVYLESLPKREDDSIHLEALGFAYVHLRKKKEAERMLEALLQLMKVRANGKDGILDWEVERRDRAAEILELVKHRPDDAIDRLRSYRNQTISALGLG